MEELKILLARVHSGDLEAFGQIVARFQDMACAYAYSILGDFQLAEDVSQEAFVEAYKQLNRLRVPDAFPGWFRRILFTRCGRMTRRKRIQSHSLEMAAGVPSKAPGPAHIVEHHEIQAQVLEAVHALPEYQRTVTMLFYINGYSQKEVAEFLEIPVTTVKKRLHDSRKRLKERMVGMVKDTLKNRAPDVRFAEKVVTRVLEINLLPQTLPRAKHRAVKKVLGLDIGTFAIKGVELTCENDRLVVTGAGWESISSAEDTSEAIRRLISKNKLCTDNVVTSLNGKFAFSRIITLDKAPSFQELQNTIKIEVEKYLPLPPEEVEWRQQVLGNFHEGTPVKFLIVAAKRDVIAEHQALLERAGLQSTILDTDTMALENAVALCTEVNPIMRREMTAAVNIGASNTSVIIGDGSDNFFIRVMPPLGIVEAKKGDQEIVKKIAAELLRTFNYFYKEMKGHKINRILLSGGAVHIDGLVELLSQCLSLGVIKFNPFEYLDVKVPNPELLRIRAPDLVVALGLASRIRSLVD